MWSTHTYFSLSFFSFFFAGVVKKMQKPPLAKMHVTYLFTALNEKISLCRILKTLKLVFFFPSGKWGLLHFYKYVCVWMFWSFMPGNCAACYGVPWRERGLTLLLSTATSTWWLKQTQWFSDMIVPGKKNGWLRSGFWDFFISFFFFYVYL